MDYDLDTKHENQSIEWLYGPVQLPTRLYNIQPVAGVQQEEEETIADDPNWGRNYTTNGDGWTIEGELPGWNTLEKL